MGYLPTVSVRTAFRGRVAVGKYRRAVSRVSMTFMIQQILDLKPPHVHNFALGNEGFILPFHYTTDSIASLTGRRIICHVRVPYFIADEMDLAKTITGMFASSQSNRPCNVCDRVFKDGMMGTGNLRDMHAIREVN